MNRRTFLVSTVAMPLAVKTVIGSNVGSTPTVQPVAASGCRLSKNNSRYSVFTKHELISVGYAGIAELVENRLDAHGFVEDKPIRWEYDIVNLVLIAEQDIA